MVSGQTLRSGGSPLEQPISVSSPSAHACVCACVQTEGLKIGCLLKFFSTLLFKEFLFCFYLFVYMWVCVPQHCWRSENLWKFSSPPLGSERWIQVVGFGGRRLYVWRHPAMTTVTPPLRPELFQRPLTKCNSSGDSPVSTSSAWHHRCALRFFYVGSREFYVGVCVA